jgi:hypothetical protein
VTSTGSCPSVLSNPMHGHDNGSVSGRSLTLIRFTMQKMHINRQPSI